MTIVASTRDNAVEQAHECSIRLHPPPARRRGGRLTPPVYDPGHKSCFDVRINPMPRGPIIAQRQETHLFAIANDAME